MNLVWFICFKLNVNKKYTLEQRTIAVEKEDI